MDDPVGEPVGDPVELVTEMRVRREALGWSRQRLVDEIKALLPAGYALRVDTMRDWELRRATPTGRYPEVLCRVLAATSLADLGLGGGSQAASCWTWATEAERRAEVRRRQLIQMGVAAAGTALLPVHELVAVGQLFGAERRIGAVEVDAACQIATHLAVRYHSSPDDDTARAALAHARTLARLLKRASMSPGTRAALAAVTSDSHSLAAYTACRDRRFKDGNAWFNQAEALAREAGEPRLEALAVAGPASVRCWTADRAGRVEALDRAATAQPHLPAATRAWISGYQAHELAWAGDDLRSGRAVDAAVEAGAQAAGEDPGWGLWSQHAELKGVDTHAATCLAARDLQVGRHAQALESYDAALQATSGALWTVDLRLGVARASIGLDDPERASAETASAFEQAKAYGLGSRLANVRDTRDRFPTRWTPLACVAALDERLRPNT